MNDENHNYTEDSSRQASQYIENGTKNGAKKIAKKAANKIGSMAKDVLKRGTKRAASESLVVLKAAAVKIGIAGAVIPAVVFIGMLFMGAMGDVLFEERGTAQSYSVEDKEDNLSGVDQEDGIRKVVALSEPQALKTAYYRLMSCASYTKNVDGKELVFYDPLEKDKTKMQEMREDFATLQDANKLEKNFLLSSDFIMMADEILHNYTVYYPEQIIKPVFHTEETDAEGRTVVKTQPLIAEGSNALKPEVVSKGYDPLPEGGYKNETNGTDVSGVWDYGLGSVLTYQSGEKDVWREGKIVWREVCTHTYNEDGSIETHTVKKKTVNESFKYENLPLTGDDINAGKREFHDSELNSKFGNNTTTYPIKIPLISSLAHFSGTKIYQYEDKEDKTPFQEGTTTTKSEAVAAYTYSSCNGTDLHEYREAYTVTKMPLPKGSADPGTPEGGAPDPDPAVDDDEDNLGFLYLDQYFANYTNYVPLGLKDDLNFERRTKDTYDLLQQLGLLEPYPHNEPSVSVVQPAVGASSLSGTSGILNDSNSDYTTWNDLTMLAHLIEAEAGNSKLDELMVGAAAFNRWKSGQWGSTMFDVIKAPSQYACYNSATGGTWARKTPTERVVESAKQVISGEFAIPANIIFQAQFVQGPLFMTVSPHYYCYKTGQTLADTDAFGRTALTAEQLQARAAQLDGAGASSDAINSSGGASLSVGDAIGGKKTVEVTYYCAACNSPPGSDAIAWSGGPTNGHAQVGATCAMSKGSMKALGVEFGDWIYIEGVGTRRVEDICGTGLGGVSGLKTDRIVIDVYCDSPGGVCRCSLQGGLTHTTAYKTTGEGASAQAGMYSAVTGLYYPNLNPDDLLDVVNPIEHLKNEDPSVSDDNNMVLFCAGPFSAYDATTKNFENIGKDQQAWYTALADGIKNFINNTLDFFKGVISGVFVDDVFGNDRFYVSPPSSTEKTHDVVYQALANTQNKLYSEIRANFDDENPDMSQLLVGDAGSGAGMFSAGFGVVNGVGSSVEGFVSPTTTYYQALIPFSTGNQTVTLATPEGTAVQAIYSGTIISNDASAGVVVIEHTAKDGKKYTVTYSNITPAISSLTTVSKEQTIGTTKAGGLQLKVVTGGKAVDPMTIFYQSTYSFDSTGLVQFALNEYASEAPAKYGMKYKQMYGITSQTTAWCTLFVGYCAKNVGLIDADLYPSNNSWVPDVWDWFKAKNWWVDKSYNPKPGDIVLFDFDGNGRPEHIGIVEYWDGAKLHTIEGNTTGTNGESSVLAKKARGNKYGVLGFGIMGGVEAE